MAEIIYKLSINNTKIPNMGVKTEENGFKMHANNDKMQANDDEIQKNLRKTGFKTVKKKCSHYCQNDGKLPKEISKFRKAIISTLTKPPIIMS